MHDSTTTLKSIRSGILRSRIIALVLAPLILSAVISTWLVTNFTQNQLNAQSQQFGQAITDQLATTAIDYLVSNDLLSLNVVLDDLLANESFEFAAIYDTNNNLLAQSGKQQKPQQSYTRSIIFQDSSLGHVLVTLETRTRTEKIIQILAGALMLHLLIALLVTGLIWFYGDLMYLWITKQPLKTHAKFNPGTAIQRDAESSLEAEPVINERTLLAIKIRPARLAPTESIARACTLYNGKLDKISDEEWCLSFDTSDQLGKSVRCGLLIKKIVDLQARKLSFKAGIDAAPKEDMSMLRKQTSYLASLSDQNLLVSQGVNAQILKSRLSPMIKSLPFHSSASTDGKVYYLESTDTLLEQQANQLI